MENKLIIGIDFGTDSARGILYDLASLSLRKQVVAPFKRWKEGLYCNPAKNQYRQHPADYTEALACIFEGLLKDLTPAEKLQVAAIGTNTTGSTPVALNEAGQVLAMLPAFAENPNAMFVLWKDHTAIVEATQINQLAKQEAVDYTAYSGGIYSSEWFWSKITHIIREDEAVWKASATWMEQSDWVPYYLCGQQLQQVKRNRCAAGHKAMWHESYDGLPAAEFFHRLEPRFEKYKLPFYTETYTSDQVFGTLAPEIARQYGLSEEVLITVGAIDAHHGAVGAGIRPHVLVKVMGTSTCDMLIAPYAEATTLLPGICGQVDGSILPGFVGYEAGQSAYGDIFLWYKKLMLAPLKSILGELITPEQIQAYDEHFFNYLSQQAAQLPPALDDLIFTDFFNGRRTPDADMGLKAAAYGFTLATTSSQLFKALVEAAAFGSKAIIERFEAYELAIHELIAIGGIAEKSPYIMQVLADVLQREIKVLQSDQVGALGSVIFASLAATAFDSLDEAQDKLCPAVATTYYPDQGLAPIYQQRYQRYLSLTQRNYKAHE